MSWRREGASDGHWASRAQMESIPAEVLPYREAGSTQTVQLARNETTNSHCKAHLRHTSHSTPASPADQQSLPCDWPSCPKLPPAPSWRVVVFWFKLRSACLGNLLPAIRVSGSPLQWSGMWAWWRDWQVQVQPLWLTSCALMHMSPTLPEPQFLHLYKVCSLFSQLQHRLHRKVLIIVPWHPRPY